jgi:hypothetical protein
MVLSIAAPEHDEALLDTKHELRSLILELPIRDREIVTLVHWDGFSLTRGRLSRLVGSLLVLRRGATSVVRNRRGG